MGICRKRKSSEHIPLAAAVYWIAVKYQQNYYEIAGDWNKYKSDELLPHLKNYIGYSIFGPPENENSIGQDGIYIYKEKGADDLINKLYEKVKEHGVQLTDGSILCTVLYCCMYIEDAITTKDETKPEELVFVRPIFKVQKNEKGEQGIAYSNWFIDTEGRVYVTWEDFLLSSNLPPCVLVVPTDGEYKANLKDTWSQLESSVDVQKFCKSGNTITQLLDVSSAAVGLGAVGIVLAAPLLPIIGATTLAACGVAGAGSAAWTGGRSVYDLWDRKTHDQNLTDSEAIPSWLGAMGSAVGGLFSGGSYLLSRAVNTGASISTSAKMAHDVFAIGNIAINLVGVGYNGYSIFKKYQDDDEISKLDVVFLTAHIFFVCNSVMSMRLADTIIQSDQKAFLKDYEKSLRSNRHRKEFRRLVKNTAPDAASSVQKNEQIIKALNVINNKDEFFATLARNRKTLSTSGAKYSFKDGNLKINDNLLLDPSQFADMSKDSIKNLLSQPGQYTFVPSTNNSQPLLSDNFLKLGLRIAKDFFVAKCGGVPDSQNIKFSDILYDLRNISISKEILLTLLETSYNIFVKINGKSLNALYKEVKKECIPTMSRFLWLSIKKIVGNNFFDKISDKCAEKKLQEFIEQFCDWAEDQWEWMWESFEEWQKNGETSDYVLTSQNETFDSTSNSSNNLVDLELVLLSNLMELPAKEIFSHIRDILNSTASCFKKSSTISEEMKTFCKIELEEFFYKHPVKKTFEIGALAEDLVDILEDLKCFDRKSIIFYKLFVISHNMFSKITKDYVLEKSLLLDLLHCIWLIVLLNLRTSFKTKITDKVSENHIVSIIIAIYWHLNDNPDCWTDEYHSYKVLHFKN